MTTYIALLHSIMLGEGRRLVMADLKATALDLGLANPRTLLATGNLIFEAEPRPVAELETALESAFHRRMSKAVDILIRSASDWQALVEGNPFSQESHIHGDQVVVRVMRQPLPVGALAALRAKADDEKIHQVRNDLWVYCPRKPNESRLLNGLTTKKLGIGTVRNWNTVRKITEAL